MLDGLGFLNAGRSKRVVFSKIPTPAVVPTLPLVQWIAELVGHEAHNLPPPSTVVKNEWNYTFSSPVCFHGACREMFTSLYLVNLNWSLKTINHYRYVSNFLMQHAYVIVTFIYYCMFEMMLSFMTKLYLLQFLSLVLKKLS